MNKYKITFEKVTYYEYEIEANSSDEAEELIEDNIDCANFLRECDGSWELIDTKEL